MLVLSHNPLDELWPGMFVDLTSLQMLELQMTDKHIINTSIDSLVELPHFTQIFTSTVADVGATASCSKKASRLVKDGIAELVDSLYQFGFTDLKTTLKCPLNSYLHQ